MINRTALLSDLQKLLQRLEADLLERSESADVPEVGKTLRAEYDRAKTAERTAQNYEDWRTDAITQAAAAWVLSCVFVRFLEDNRLIDPPKISGQSSVISGQSEETDNRQLTTDNSRLQRARDEHELYFRGHPTETDREYLLAVFDQLAKLPGTKDVFGEHNPIHELPNWLSGDAAGEVLRFFQKIDANTGALVHDFSDPEWDTRFLGDLYQDLSEAARKKYALLQTPEFVEEFILDRTLDPAVDEFGLEGFKMIDPACGSGHFLLGAFHRIENLWERKAPDAKCREVVQWTLNSIFGVDVNPFAVAIARFRLLLAALRTCGVLKLAHSPAFHINLVCGDSLLHAPLSGGQQVLDFELAENSDECDHAYRSENLPELKRLLRGGQYHAVVANPPYITPKDRQLNERYRKRFTSCHMKYSLAVPFLERIFRLAVTNGYTGQITANSFMKREFGKKMIESFFPTVDLTHVIDTSGAFIPGHSTPTVILFGRHRSPVASTIRAVMGIQGEPSTPIDPSQGVVWSAIVAQIDQPNSESAYASVGDSERARFHKHPWSIGGGGAAELKEQLDESGESVLASNIKAAGVLGMTNAEDVMVGGFHAYRRAGVETHLLRRIAAGEDVRDWQIMDREYAFFPYENGSLIHLDNYAGAKRFLWPYRTSLGNRATFSKQTYFAEGRPWWEWHQLTASRVDLPHVLAMANIATHNHFAFDCEQRLQNVTVVIIQLRENATEDDHLALLGLLNSSTACFWMKQVCFPKGTTTGDISKEKGKAEANRFAFNATAIGELPLPSWTGQQRERVIRLAKATSCRGSRIAQLLSTERLRELLKYKHAGELTASLEKDCEEVKKLRREMIFFQEELDWVVYASYGLKQEEPLEWDDDLNLAVSSVSRPFCCDELPSNLPEQFRELWRTRQTVMRELQAVRLIETPVFKRPWVGRQGVYGSASRTTVEQQSDVQRMWLLNRLESYFDFDGRLIEQTEPNAKLDVALTSLATLADLARQDPHFMDVAAIYRDDPAFDVQRLVIELVQPEHIPLLPALRYKPSGLRKRHEWEKTWELQRQEDSIDARTQLPKDDPQYLTEDQARDLKQREIGDIPVPPKYTSSDFISTGGARYWALRGKLDVPKERWISFPHCEGPDGTLVIAWAGYDHLQQARAISAYYVRVQTEFGGSDDARLIPLLACLIELIPWLKQWHNEPDAAYDGMRMGDYFEGFVNEEARQLNQTISEIKAWTPPAKTGRRGRK